MNKITLTTVIERQGDYPFQKVAGETVIVEPAAKLLHHLNETASEIWGFLDRPRTVEAIINQLVETYETDPATLETDTRRFLEEMSEMHLISLK